MAYAFIFPGQGSQSVGMMNGFAELSIAKDTFLEASDVLGKDFWSMVTTGTEETLAQTVNTQPLMLTAGIAAYRTWLHLGGTHPTALAGHSLGELTALVAGGALSFNDALIVTETRAKAMQEAVPVGVGAMAAILGVDDTVVEEICTLAKEQDVLEPANFNSPGQVVIAGHRSAIERAVKMAKEKGAKRAVILAMSVPSHCSLLTEASEKLSHILDTITVSVPTIPLYHNVHAGPSHSPQEIKTALITQMYSPVRWVSCIQAMANLGITTFYECGPGKVLAPLVKRIDSQLTGIALNDCNVMKNAIEGN
ncbi:MAG: malonyl CoA-acyl carrier protein transacylase [Ferrovum sp. 37-45-19]|uniref:ACP S-malonyltransferase n=1 Tax=Ferrovum sp. JA12 TaxID=1356299 RepID=UPI000703B73A|nr:ACP S-malonyltransferase [Ferrovum sp. JA12]OYV80339.1 MAG: malonyl CoA-acyl carrier protein transacylase [Ferrovum sp. 21-44-67]OYV95083.1 MAG: malonyl CoA-acyl carrier protein transacylase [Ferrovum sp. 37-45-19]OZB31808.1 MAG: malonyl CoA-acyl carrier protein transacylase [Ferrovum sp. 34-44-207]HQT80853.1 ACP S-malonyltransferase [Ferrovaceae bacterium]KRH78694.1 malonyl CoA-acyl carrier protein transacylase [Ferrovum sp. JA12]